MKYNFLKKVVCLALASVIFLNCDISANASNGMVVKNVLPSAGMGIDLSQSSQSLQSIAQAKGQNSQVIDNIEDTLDVRSLVENQVSDEDAEFSNLVIAQVNDYVNVRSMPSEEGEIVGKLYNNSVGDLLEEENGWYQISSGNVVGYVKAEYCVTGEDAIELAKELDTRIATVKTVTLYVKKEMAQESEVLGYLAMGDQVIVLEETEEWCKVSVEEGDGYVSKELVSLHSEFVTAESKEEEAARLAEEQREREEAREAARLAALEKAQTETVEESVAVDTAVEPTDIGIDVAEYACQFVGNPYKWGGTSLTEGADCSGFVMSVYANFGVELPHSSASDRNVGYGVDGLENAIPGDIICYSGHVAIYIGDGQIVHASTEKTGIIISDASYRKILCIRRIF